MKPLFFSLPPEVHPDCRDFVTQVEMLLLWRQQETVEGTIKQPVDEQEDDWGPRKWHRKELEDMVYSSYKRMRQGHITRPPRREVVLEIADYLHCSFEERNRLLIAAHTLPVEQYLTGPALANMVHEIREVACVLPMPALIMNRDWQILYFNAAMLHLYDLSSEQIATIPASSLNFLQLLCDPALPLYANLIGNRKSWTRMVLQTIQGFKTANQFSRYEPWYQQLIQRLLLFPEFAQCWEQVAQTKNPGMAQNLSSSATLDTVVPALHDPSRPITLRPLVISLGYFQFDFPQIIGLLPAQVRDREIFQEIGLSCLLPRAGGQFVP